MSLLMSKLDPFTCLLRQALFDSETLGIRNYMYEVCKSVSYRGLAMPLAGRWVGFHALLGHKQPRQ
jgi:hypothetical protein